MLEYLNSFETLSEEFINAYVCHDTGYTDWAEAALMDTLSCWCGFPL
jgi:hypothetical protein